MDNIHIAKLLDETADLMEIAAEDGFRIRSYRNAAKAIEGYPDSVLAILADTTRKVTDIPGIGKGIAAVLAEIAARGSFERRDEMLEKYPPTSLELLKIQGLGPKSIAVLIEQFRVSTIDDLERICREQKLRDLPRMGAKLEEKILKSIAQYRRSAGRFLIDFATETANEVKDLFASIPGITSISPAGSVRRGKETIGDVDILVAGENALESLEVFARWGKVDELLAKGENKASARVGVEGIQVDVRALPESSFGAAMQYFTGSKEHNVNLRTRAIRLGYTLNEYSLSRESNGEVIASATEAEIYQALGLAYIPPELRENTGEIEAAEKNTLPVLLEVHDIRGDLHMHTRESDGRGTLEEMAQAAKAYGHEYIVITDHSKALAMANGLDEKRAIDFARMVRGIEIEEFGLKVFSGLECDILKNGKMDLENEALAALDFVVASVHSHMNLDEQAMTDRLLAALENPYIHTIGHPTGRVLLHRDAYHYAFEKVAAKAAEKGVYLEINASPERLDLHAALIRAAKSRGCRFTISTDAHHVRSFQNMKYGVQMARRGWLEKADVINTQARADFEKTIRQARAARLA
ncbi:DNA polymerase/3'-5' exonuclease PolX [Bryobacter aggregatus]|uniref:DNA polymerase/3'-5' exonuclease PolX n=1 Tax=Bryobacter aggregatus TaxID=360054 RepID=UPI0004E24127|nr:DNA polymerase/3'-5' exonuclease PolX [Bryobacter aggregatus]